MARGNRQQIPRGALNYSIIKAKASRLPTFFSNFNGFVQIRQNVPQPHRKSLDIVGRGKINILAVFQIKGQFTGASEKDRLSRGQVFATWTKTLLPPCKLVGLAKANTEAEQR